MKKIVDIIKGVIIAILLWASITCLIQSFVNIHLTKGEIFENIPNSFLLDFK